MDTVTDAADATAVSCMEAASAWQENLVNASDMVAVMGPENAGIQIKRLARDATSPEMLMELKMADVTFRPSAALLSKINIFFSYSSSQSL